MAALSLQDNGPCPLRQAAEDPLDVGDHLGIDSVSFCGPRQPHERHRSALTDDHAVRQVPRGLIDAAVDAIPRSAGMPAHSLLRLLWFRARSVGASWIKHCSRLRCSRLSAPAEARTVRAEQVAVSLGSNRRPAPPSANFWIGSAQRSRANGARYRCWARTVPSALV